ncbi:MAG: hypothetical protein HOP36_08235 [Methyloglobulus sp.]|nr:hypothetical protein [Methyloglobulus sp.]
MNILWVEDNPGNKKDFWFANRNVKNITDFSEAEETIAKELNSYDVVVLDIDLTNSDKEIVRDKSEQFNLSPDDFLQKSGMVLFLILLERGFPRRQIIFLTGNTEKNTFSELVEKISSSVDEEQIKSATEKALYFLSDEQKTYLKQKDNKAEKVSFIKSLAINQDDSTYGIFSKACNDICIKPPNAIAKSNDKEAQAELRNWLEDHERNDYLILRRGIIEGCQFLRTQKEKLRFEKYSADEKKPAFLDVDDYLDVLESFLPLREPSNKTAFYKLFVRTLAHEWEESVKPKKIDDDQTAYAFSWIMKMTRNWMAHNSTAIFNNLTEQDVAYLFICNMRAIFDLGNEAKDYEKSLFLLFNKSEESEAFKESEQIVKEKRIPLVKNYVSYFNEKTKRIQVHNILHDLQNDKAKLKTKGDDFFITGLYHCFWFLTSEHDDKKDKAVENNRNPNQVYISRHYTFSCFDYTQSEFLLKFSSHIYNISFPQGE